MNDLWGLYKQLNKTIPIININYFGLSFIIYYWSDWDDFFNRLSEYVIGLSNADGIFITSPKKIYKRNDLLRALRENVRFIFFKGHRVYTDEELYWIESVYTYYPCKNKIREDLLKFYLKEAMEVRFDDLIHYIR